MRLYDENGSKVRRRLPFRRLMTAAATGGVVVGMAFAAGTGPLALAAAKTSSLVATPNPVALDPTTPKTTQVVTVALDSNCSNALDNGHTYSITAVSSNTGAATVSPSESGALHCGSNASFTVTSVCNGSAAVNFLPVVDNGAPGLQNKLGGTSVPVTVTGYDPLVCTGSTGGGDDRPAAPSVTNAYLNVSAGATAACKATFNNAKSWRGSVVSFIAGWMPKPESIKSNTTIFPDPGDWVAYVESEVNHKCGITGIPDWPIPPTSGLPGYTATV
jgi:hypothetical protein